LDFRKLAILTLLITVSAFANAEPAPAEPASNLKYDFSVPLSFWGMRESDASGVNADLNSTLTWGFSGLVSLNFAPGWDVFGRLAGTAVKIAEDPVQTINERSHWLLNAELGTRWHLPTSFAATTSLSFGFFSTLFLNRTGPTTLQLYRSAIPGFRWIGSATVFEPEPWGMRADVELALLMPGSIPGADVRVGFELLLKPKVYYRDYYAAPYFRFRRQSTSLLSQSILEGGLAIGIEG